MNNLHISRKNASEMSKVESIYLWFYQTQMRISCICKKF